MNEKVIASGERLLVVIPAWNEASVIGDVLTELRTAVPWADVVVVSDGSVDDTAKIARDGGVKVLELPLNLGVGAAMRTGYLYARRNAMTGPYSWMQTVNMIPLIFLASWMQQERRMQTL